MGLQQSGKLPDIEKMTAQLRKTLPLTIGNLAKNHYLEGFRRGGGQTNASRSGWKQRKKKDKQKTRRSILVKTGQLRNDIDIRRTTESEIVLGTSDTIYASFHNEGAGFLPKREFLGDSKILNAKISRHITKKAKKIYG